MNNQTQEIAAKAFDKFKKEAVRWPEYQNTIRNFIGERWQEDSETIRTAFYNQMVKTKIVPICINCAGIAYEVLVDKKAFRDEIMTLALSEFDKIDAEGVHIPDHLVKEAIALLEKAGYVVLKEAEYESINASN